MANIAFITPSGGFSGDDAYWQTRLTSTLGHSVTGFADDDAETTDFSSYDAIIIGCLIDPTLINGNMKSETIPILVFRNSVDTELGMADSNGNISSQTVDVQDNSHYITSHLSEGSWSWAGSAQTVQYHSGTANDMVDLVTRASYPDRPCISVCESGDTLNDSSTAAERRCYYGLWDDDDQTADSLQAFDQAIGWCLYEDVGGEALEKNLTETLTITGAITEDFTKEVTETMTLTDVITQDFSKMLSESMTITDVFTYAFTKALSETLTITGTISRDTIKELTESMTITGVVQAAIGELFTLNLSETMTITDSLHKILYDLSVFDPVTVVQVILYSNWNETTVTRPTIRSFVKREVEQGTIKRWDYITQGDLIGISETGFEKTPSSAGYDYTTTVIKLKLNIGTAKGRTHLFAVFDELRRAIHEKRGAPTDAYTSWRPLVVTDRQIHYDKFKKLWRMDVTVELREKCYALT